MEIARNQKGIKSLIINDQIWNEIIDPSNKLIVAYGSNGRGKSTIKDLFQHNNLTKNFEIEDEDQVNALNSAFGQSNFLIYDEDFVNNFVYSNDGLKKNQLKIILKNSDINEIINNKATINEVIRGILNTSLNYKSKIETIERILDIKAAGSPTLAQKRFSTTFIDGQLPHSYEDIITINDPNHKSWWYEGLFIYKHSELDFCPWCKTPYNSITEEIKNQISSVNQVAQIDSKLFDSKISKKADLTSLIGNYSLSDNSIIIIEQLISLIDFSIESNKEIDIISNMKDLRAKMDNDKSIFEEILSKVKYIDNLLNEDITDLTNKLNKLAFFSSTDPELLELSNKLVDFITNNHQLVENVRISNNRLVESIGSSEGQINKLLENLGLKYRVEINRNSVIRSGLTDSEEYVVLKSLTGRDVSVNISTTLSYGEKSTLAFAIFIQQIRNLSNENTIIIFDDPISSYDIFRRFTTISVLYSLKNIEYKKIVILTHESSFLISIINNLNVNNNDIVSKALLLNETASSNIEMVPIDSDYRNEVNLYKSMLDMSNQNINLSQRILALRHLHDLYKLLSGRTNNLSFYNYVCKLVHYRKDEDKHWDNDYIIDLRKIYEYFGIEYNSDIEQMGNEAYVFDKIDQLSLGIVSKDAYDISLEELCSFRMISESIIRNESADLNRFKKVKRTMWFIEDSPKKEELEGYRVLLNSISHIDDEEMAWPNLYVEDLKTVPRVIISQILSILR